MGRIKTFILLNMLLSIIIPTLNEEDYLPRLLKSIKKQDFESYEIIISDANSTDNTVKIAKDFGCRTVKGGNPAEGRNKGAEVAKGDLLLFLDADLVLSEEFLKFFLIPFIKRDLDCATCFISSDGGKFDKLGFKAYNYYVRATEKFLAHATQVILVKKKVHKKVGGFDREIKLAEDHMYAREIQKMGKFGIIKTEPVIGSSRRFKKEGRIKTFLKYVIAEFYTIFFGPIKSDIFKYKFNHYKKDN